MSNIWLGSFFIDAQRLTPHALDNHIYAVQWLNQKLQTTLIAPSPRHFPQAPSGLAAESSKFRSASRKR